MIRLGEFLCGLLFVLLMVPVFVVGLFAALLDIGHYFRIRAM